MRLQPILTEIINPHQLTFLSKFILDNVLFMQETIHHAKSSSQPLMFLKLDISKAYDKVDLGFLLTSISKVGFPDGFIYMIQLLFMNLYTWSDYSLWKL